MWQIRKYVLKGHETAVDLPHRSKFLHFDAQGGNPTMWWLVPEDGTGAPRKFFVHATGDKFDDSDASQRFLATALFGGGMYVWHLFTEAVWPALSPRP